MRIINGFFSKRPSACSPDTQAGSTQRQPRSARCVGSYAHPIDSSLQSLYLYTMSLTSTSAFVWEDAQCFFGVDNHIVTSYTNELLTLSIVQDKSGELVGITYETDEDEGTIELGKKVSETNESDKS